MSKPPRLLGADVALMVTSDWRPPQHARYRRAKMLLAAAYRRLYGAGQVHREGDQTPAASAVQTNVELMSSLRSELLIELHHGLGQLRSELLEISSAVHLGHQAHERSMEELQVQAAVTDGRLDRLEARQRTLDGWDRWRLDEVERRLTRQGAWLRMTVAASPAGHVLVNDERRGAVVALLNGAVDFEQTGASLVVADCGPMLVPQDDRQIAPSIEEHGTWSQAESTVILEAVAAGGTLVDIGAHTGYFGLLALSRGRVEEVLFVEADPVLAQLIERNLHINGRAGRVLAAAAADSAGELFLSAEEEGNPGDQRLYQEARTMGKWVPTVRLDDVLDEDPATRRVAAVKTDCQGRDHLALLGMERVLRRDRPVVVSEFWPEAIAETGWDPLDVLQWLSSLDYQITVVDPGAPEVEGLGDVVAVAAELPGGSCTLRLLPPDDGSSG